jgi:patatin-like phospholipase/acyl hydrolase
MKYKANTFKKWVSMSFGLLLGLILGIYIPKGINMLTHSSYNRAGLDKIMTDLLGEYHIKDTLADDTLIVAYDYNSQEPRFFSKYFSLHNPRIFDVPVGNATGASSAAPTFFDPKV